MRSEAASAYVTRLLINTNQHNYRSKVEFETSQRASQNLVTSNSCNPNVVLSTFSFKYISQTFRPHCIWK